MAMSVAHLNYVRQIQNTSRLMLDIQGSIQQERILGSGVPDYLGKITQQDIDASFPDSGVTVQALADAQYILSIIGDNVNSALVALTILANLP